MASNAKSGVTEAQQKAIKARLKAWASQPENKSCADCGRSNPGWASVNLGVLVCLECCGQHRNLGVHISKMRSISLDTITPQEERFLRSMSNTLANRWWAAKLTDSERERDVKSGTLHNKKYGLQKWKLDDGTPVPSPSNVPDSHPWWKDMAASSSASSQAAAAAGTAADPAASRTSMQLKPAPRPNPRPQAAPAAPAATPAPAAAPPPAPVDLISMDDGWASSDAAPSASTAPRQQLNDPFSAPSAATSAPSSTAALDPFASFSSDPPPQPAQPPAQVDPFAHSSSSLSLAPSPAPSAGPPAAGGDPFASHAVPSAPGGGPGTQQPSSTTAPHAPANTAHAASASNGSSQWSQAFQAPAAPPPAAPAANPAVDRQKLNAHILSLYSSPAPSQVSAGPYMGMPSGHAYQMQGAPPAYNGYNGYAGPKI